MKLFNSELILLINDANKIIGGDDVVDMWKWFA